jgi:hypothetical protein
MTTTSTALETLSIKVVPENTLFQGTVRAAGTITTDGGFIGTRATSTPAVNTTTATQLTVQDSGKLLFLGTTTALTTIKLPAAAISNGVNYKFVIAAAAGIGSITIQAGSTIIQGFQYSTAAAIAGIVGSNATNCVITATSLNLKIGSVVDFQCDGTNWYCQALGAGAGAMVTFS